MPEFRKCFELNENKELDIHNLGKGWNKFDDFLLSLDGNYKNKDNVKDRYLNMQERKK